MSRASHTPADLDDAELAMALREGDEAAFASLMDAYSSAMLRVAAAHVPSRAVAEEVVQETWLAVIRGLDRFEGRSSLRTWIFAILRNVASTRGGRERRMVPVGSLAGDGGARFEVDGHWRLAPTSWATPDDAAVSAELRERVGAAIEALPPGQRAVVSLRDVEGWSAADTCVALGLSDGNMRVLLHRARTKLRAVLERYHADL